MRSAAEYKEILARFKKEFGAQFGIKELGIFGSVARGEVWDGGNTLFSYSWGQLNGEYKKDNELD